MVKHSQGKEMEGRVRVSGGVKDDRFKKLNYDPKFKSVPQDMKKVKVDKRFSGMMTKEKFKVVSKVDKYGRRVQNPKENKELKEYYEMEEEEPTPQQQSKEMGEEVEMDVEQEEVQHSLGSQEEENLQDWMENYNEESDTESELQIQQLLDQEKELWSDDQKVIKNENVKVTKRLALCNYDWTHIKPTDLMVIFNSFKPPTGVIEKIELYQSDFGKERMANESVVGPGDIWKKKEETNDKLANRKKILKKLFTHGKKEVEETDVDMEKLRQYEKERMRYYYAVIYCDSKSTAEALYTFCDGNQLENSNNIDLRFIPSDLVFPREPEEVCDKLPQKTGNIKNKIMRSIGHSHVKLSWEDPEAGNLSKLKNMAWDKLKSSEYEGIDWSLYINDEMSEGEKEREEQRRNEEGASGSEMEVEEEYDGFRRNNKKDRISNNDQQMEIIFSGGFDLANKVKAKRQQQLEKRTEKREIKKEKEQKKRSDKKRKQQEEEEEEDFEEKLDPKEREKRKDYLELMVDNKKPKKEFTPNISDPRFEGVYKDPNLQIDPNSSLFNPEKTGNVFKEVVRRAKNRNQ